MTQIQYLFPALLAIMYERTLLKFKNCHCLSLDDQDLNGNLKALHICLTNGATFPNCILGIDVIKNCERMCRN